MNTINNNQLGYQINNLFQLFLLTVFIIVNIILMVMAYLVHGNNWITFFSILSIVQLVVNVFAINKFGENIFSLPVLFLFFSWVFHFGNIIIFGLHLNNKLTFDMLSQSENAAANASVIFSFCVQSFVAFGIFLTLIFKKNNELLLNSNIKDDPDYLNLIRRLGIILIIIGVVPTLYIDVGKIILFFSSGYVATYSLEQNGPLVILARLFKVGIFLMIIGNKNKPKIATSIFLFIVCYQFIIMLSGNRGQSVVEIIVFLYLYTNIINKIKIKTIIPYACIVYFLIVILNTLTVFRQENSPSFVDLCNAFIDSFQSSPIILVLNEFGGTLVTVYYSFLSFSGNDHIQYGTNYLLSLLTIFPNIGGIFDNIYNNAIYVSNFPLSFQTFIGGSYIGELYFSFRQMGIPFALFIGIFISLFSIKIKHAIIQKKYILLSIYLIIFPDIIWWIRGYFVEIVRYPIWISLIVYVVYDFLKRKSKNQQHSIIQTRNNMS